MFRIFSSIRQGLINKSQTSKYFRYALGEIVLVVVGILIALQVNNWNIERSERKEEREILLQIKAELEGTLEGLTTRFIPNLQGLRKSMDGIEAVFEGAPLEDPVSFLDGIARLTLYGTGQPPMTSTTYEELLNSGRLGLIQNIALRRALTSYYNFNEGEIERSKSNISEFPRLAYELIPRRSTRPTFGANSRIEQGLDDATYRRIAEDVLNSDIKHYMVPVKNRFLLIEFSWTETLERATELLDQIEKELSPH